MSMMPATLHRPSQTQNLSPAKHGSRKDISTAAPRAFSVSVTVEQAKTRHECCKDTSPDRGIPGSYTGHMAESE